VKATSHLTTDLDTLHSPAGSTCYRLFLRLLRLVRFTGNSPNLSRSFFEAFSMNSRLPSTLTLTLTSLPARGKPESQVSFVGR